MLRRVPGGLILILLFVAAGCASSQPNPGMRPADSPLPSNDLEGQLRAEVSRWEGTPHRLGGTDRSGVDCSGFVRAVYDDLFGLQLPRATDEQVYEGRPVRRRELRTGDLVFFRPTAKTRHVGIYLGEGEFAHASSSQGVTRSHLDEAYWRKAYWTSRRVLTGLSAAPERPEQGPPPVARHEPKVPTPPPPRIGW